MSNKDVMTVVISERGICGAGDNGASVSSGVMFVI